MLPFPVSNLGSCLIKESSMQKKQLFRKGSGQTERVADFAYPTAKFDRVLRPLNMPSSLIIK